MKGNVITGFDYFLAGFKMILKPALLPYVLTPILINISIFAFATWYIFSIFSGWMGFLMGFVPGWLSFIEWIVWPIFVLTLGTFFFFIFNIIANIVASPFNGLLAEKAELLLSKETAEASDWLTLLKNIPASIAREFRKLFYYLPRLFLLSLLSFIPGVNILVFLFAAWMMAIQYIDYPMDNNKITFRGMLPIIKSRNITAFGFGAIVMLSLMIPLLNFIVIPVAVCGATLFWVNELKQPQLTKNTH